MKTKIKVFAKFVVGVGMLMGIGLAVGLSVGFTNSADAQTVYISKEVQVPVEMTAPVLDRISDCESGTGKVGSASQFNKAGQVLVHVNTNGTYDIGKYQINSIHNADATKRGFNLSTEEGNTGYAKYMYANLGTGDWSSSQACWK